jgi:palmitoyltransferase
MMAKPVHKTRTNGRASSMLVRTAQDCISALLTCGYVDKKLLITCLQYLNNLIARNEQRKLMLWIELFDSHLDNELPNFADMKYKMDMSPHFYLSEAVDAADGSNVQKNGNGQEALKNPRQPASSPFLLYIGEVGHEVKTTLIQHGEKAGATEIAAECRRRWQTMMEDEKNVGTSGDSVVIVIVANMI